MQQGLCVPVYDKLVRDLIPKHLTELGITFRTRRLDGEEYQARLLDKLGEETDELRKARTDEERLAELADVLEVVYALAEHLGGHAVVEHRRLQKLEARGAFTERILLLETDD